MRMKNPFLKKKFFFLIAPELSISHYCFKIFVGISDEWDALFESKLLYFLFYASKRHCFERKTFAFFEDCFDT